jgi:adenylate cyclase
VTRQRVERRLAAVLAADVAGYSRLMGADEVGTLEALKAHRRELIDPSIAAYKGRIVKTTGDGMLVEFASAVDAVTCAIDVQAKMLERNASAAQKITFRIGINVGDIIIDGDDIFGDGVNVAARVENECEPGGVYLSDDAFRHVQGKMPFAFEDMGERSLKNIGRAVRIYAVRASEREVGAGHPAPAEADSSLDPSSKPLPLPDKPSIAVLPFENMSGDPEQEYFADGMVEEIITALSRFKWLFVIARNSSFTFKGRAVDIKEVGRSLGVRYVLEGSVRKAAGKVRITGQLIDAVTGAHIWADRFERDLTDVFALQDEVTVAVVSAIQPKLFHTEIAKATRRRPENLIAYDFFLRALPQFYSSSPESLAEAIRLTHCALELDPRFGWVAALAALCHSHNVIAGYAADPQFDRNEAIRLSRLALSLDDDDPEILSMAAVALAFMVGDSENEIEMADRAVSLNPNSFHVWLNRGWVYQIAGLPEKAIQSFERAIRMSPIDPLLYRAFTGMGMALIELRRFDEAIVAGKRAQHQNPSYPSAYRCLTSVFAHLGRYAEASEAVARLLELDPAFTISACIARGGQANSNVQLEGLRKAGLPE